jgi:hypothetical protein
MLLERYEYEIGNSFHQYDFYSEGPKGKIKKIVLYSWLGSLGGFDYYNLGFGDYDEAAGRINDLSVTNNQNRRELHSPIGCPEIIRIFAFENEDIWEFLKITIIILKSLLLLEVRKRLS